MLVASIMGMESFIHHAWDTIHRLQSFCQAHSSATSFPFLDTPLFTPKSEDQGVQMDPIGTSRGMGTSRQAMAEEDWYEYTHEEEGDQDDMDIQEGEVEGDEVDNLLGYGSIASSNAEGIDEQKMSGVDFATSQPMALVGTGHDIKKSDMDSA
ncbi:hypothetical protein GYMLUDRAFT_251458 [Collybiopsis luxurians FD-317 M1]|uniref:Uncharacterized protein n=1 Tax=Collybiopsis luxurians FD-317 M1 TaxID=944289 RepID=A0A0D0BRF1_9AGAR|nr:hypothetical protein GYMLUDRAFT_251458 [Collybiopsis luxurians FD-317 M1]